MVYQPALDGVRAVAVIAVLLFHSEFEWASGGYLGVSVFFTLSGYLITTLLMREHDSSGRIGLGNFYARRLRRLLPASVLTLVLIAVMAMVGIFDRVDDLGSKLRWAAVNAANWDQLRAQSSYAALFSGGDGTQSPVLHFWSLAIEEQFYLVAPLALVGLFAWTRNKPTRRLPILVGTYVASLGASWWIAASVGPDAAYLNTFARLGELIVGMVVAAVLHRRTVSPRVSALAWPAASVIIAAIVLTGASIEAWPYRGGLPVFALATGALLVGLQAPSALRGWLSAAPLVSIGTVSYGLYLFHWPVFLWLSETRLGFGGVPLLVMRVVVVGAITMTSFVLLEEPIRRRRGNLLPTIGAGAAALGIAIALTFATPTAITAVATPDDLDQDKVAAVAISPSAEPDVVAESTVAPATDQPLTSVDEVATEPPRTSPLRILVVGDSTAVALGSGLVERAYDSDGDIQVSIAAHGGCGLVAGGEYRSEISNAALDMNCRDIFDRQIPDILANATPDIAIVMVTLADTWTRSWDGGVTWLDPNDAEYAERIRRDYATFFTALADRGVPHIVWLRPPVSSYAGDDDVLAVDSSFLDGGQDFVESVVRDLQTSSLTEVTIIDFRSWFESSTLADDPASRPDGTHLSLDAAQQVVDEWLFAELGIGSSILSE